MPNPYVNKVQKSTGEVLIDLSTDTVSSAADIVSGKVGHLRDGSVVTGTASGGGGASNLVTGTFKGTTTGAAIDVTLNYSGSGYPIAAIIYPTGGAYNSSAASGTNAYNWYNLIQRYAIGMYAMSKNISGTAPNYDTSLGTNYSKAMVLTIYKSSTSSATSTSATRGNDTVIMRDNNATASSTEAVKFRSKTKMSVFIAGTSYGFAANIEYTYHVIYSS